MGVCYAWAWATGAEVVVITGAASLTSSLTGGPAGIARCRPALRERVGEHLPQRVPGPPLRP